MTAKEQWLAGAGKALLLFLAICPWVSAHV